jgi:myo-inositol-1(or 4)-monophosphatase
MWGFFMPFLILPGPLLALILTLPNLHDAQIIQQGTAAMRDELKLAMDAGRQAGAITLKYYGGRIEAQDKNQDSGYHDGDFNPLTQADIETDTYLKTALLDPYPHYGWLSEETADTPQRLNQSTLWIVDPIDGTREFIQGIPEYVVSIALVENGEPTVGVIYNPATDELFASLKGGGTHLNGKRVFCTETSSLDQAVLTVSRSETKRGEIAPFESSVKEIRPLGSVAYKLAVVAAGLADLNFSVQSKNEWDVVAGDLLMREAGGLMLDLSGQPRRYNQADPLIKGGLAAGNPQLAQAAVKLITARR